jgi:hypothetical protein
VKHHDRGIQYRSEMLESFAGWSLVQRVEESEDFAFIYVTSLSAHVIRKNRVVEGDIAAFLDSVRARISEAQANRAEAEANEATRWK